MLSFIEVHAFQALTRPLNNDEKSKVVTYKMVNCVISFLDVVHLKSL